MPETRTAALQYDAATLHESAGRVGALPARLKPAYPAARVAGPAFPVMATAGDNLWIQRAIYGANPGDVLVVATSDYTAEYGYWGEILSEAAVVRGLGGLVIDGGVRDTVELARVGFPIIASSICIRGTEKNPSNPGSAGLPVTLGTVVVNRGDLVLGDADGVVVLPAARSEEVLAKAADRVAKEADIIAQLRRGKTSLELYNL